jgi:hypothetical protein
MMNSRGSRAFVFAALLALASQLPADESSLSAAVADRDSVLFDSRLGDFELQGVSFDAKNVWTHDGERLLANMPSKRQEKSFATFGSPDWSDYAVDLDLCGLRGVDKGIAVRVSGHHGIGIDLRGTGYHDVLLYRGHSAIARASAPNANNQPHHLRIEAEGTRYRVYVDGELKIDCNDSSLNKGKVALAAYTGGAGECEVWFDHVVVTRLPRVEPVGLRER